MRNSVENLIIGGGPAGSMMAIRLAAAGRRVMLVEKEREPHHKVCGEFLSQEAIRYLQSAGIEPRALDAHPIQRVHLHSANRSVSALLPFPALSLSRRVLDETLLQRAQAAGCQVLRGSFVERLQPDGGSWKAHIRGSEPINATTVFLATGKHNLPQSQRHGSQNDLVGFKKHWKLACAQNQNLQGLMELFLFRGGYGGLALIEGGLANLCLVIRSARLRELGGWPALLDSLCTDMPTLAYRLRDAKPCWPKPLAISSIPYGYLGGDHADGIWPIGDQVAVIPSFTGDGMSIALHTAELASQMFLAGSSRDQYIERLTRQLRAPMRLASACSRIMVTGPGRILAPEILKALPGFLGWIASRTRIPASALGFANMSSRSQSSPPTASAA